MTVVARLVASAVAGGVVFVLLHPFSGDDSDPPTCYSVFEWVVPCQAWVSVVACLGTSVVVVVTLFAIGRRR